MNAGIATERAMKRGLDGTFTRRLGDGTVKTERVRWDFQPTYEGMFPPAHLLSAENRAPVAQVKLRTPFTKHEDRRIVALHRIGASYRTIADAIGRQHGSVDQRVRHLKREGRI